MGRTRVVSLAAAASAVLLLAACGSAGSGSRRRTGTTSTPASAPASTTASPTPAPQPLAHKPSRPHERVPRAVPTSFTISGPRFTIKARVCSMAPVFPLDPPGEQHHTVCWVTKGFGVMPGSDTATSYLLGHSWAEDDSEVLNALSSRATAEILRVHPTTLDGVPVYPVRALDGYTIVLRTTQGVLTYKVRSAFGVAKSRAGNVATVVDQKVRHRVVLITCAERNGVDYDYNIVVNAYLWSSTRATA